MIEIRKPDAVLAKLLPPVILRKDIQYIPSQFTIPFEQNGKLYVFHNLTKQCIEGTLPISAKVGEDYDDLITANFLVPIDKDECVYYNQISSLVRTYSRKKGIQGYTILPTFSCNARCIYCYEENMRQVTMTPETVEQAIRYILNTHYGNKVSLSWFGGEPLMCPSIIDRICEGIKNAGLEYESGMISNGSLITSEIIKKMIDDWKLNHIQISMDGIEKDYIFRKRYYSYNDNFKKVIETISAMSEAGITVTIRCNVDEENGSGVTQFLKNLKEGVTHKKNVGVYFSPLNNVRMGENDVEMWKKIKDIWYLIEEAGFRSTPFLGLGLGFRTNHCMADAGNVVITPEGNLFPCEHCPPESNFGDIWHGTTDEFARYEFCRVDKTREKCKSCPFLPDCTSFATCPVQDIHCREVHELMVIDALKRMVEKKESENIDEDTPIC